MKTFSITNIGRVRQSNQDRFLIKKEKNGSLLFVVADGVGGSYGGEYAAEEAIRVMESMDISIFQPDMGKQLCHQIQLAHTHICDIALKNERLQNMGSTITAAFVAEGNISWAYLGDTRLYLFRNGSLQSLTRDHTIPGLLLKERQITREAARKHPMRHGILKCLGGRDAKPDFGFCRLESNDIVFACSDGLHGQVSEDDIKHIIQNGNDPAEMAQALVSAALDAGGEDNITLAGVRL